MDCKSFTISEGVVKMIVALTLKTAKEYFRMMLWLMMMHHHIKFIRSEILSRKTLTKILNFYFDLDLEHRKKKSDRSRFGLFAKSVAKESLVQEI